MKELIHKLKEKSVKGGSSACKCLEGKPKDSKGITLIALIITIIVMLILVSVTVTFTIGENGIFQSTKQAIFKQEISQIKEYIELEKETIRIEFKGTIPDNYSYEPETLINNIPNDLREKYLDNAKLEVLIDGKLYYNEANLQEPIQQKWCRDLGILANPAFPSYVEALKNKHYDDTYIYGGDNEEAIGKRDLEQVRADIKEKYPEAAFTYITPSGQSADNLVMLYSSEEYHDAIIEPRNVINTLYEFAIKNNKDTVTEADLDTMNLTDEQKELAKTLEFPLGVNDLKGKKTVLDFSAAAVALYVFYEGEEAVIWETDSFTDIYPTIDIEFMSNEDSKVFTFANSDYNDEYYKENGGVFENKKDLKITAYNGTSSNIIVPAFIENDEHEIVKVIEIDTGTFSADDAKPLKANAWDLLSGEALVEKKYEDATLNDVVTVIKKALSQDYSERVGENGDFKNDEDKEELIFDAVKNAFGLDDDMDKYFTLEYADENNPEKVTNMYAYITESTIDGVPFFIKEIIYDEKGNIIYTPTIENIEISEGILKVGAKAFYPSRIGTIVFPTTIEDVTDALKGLGCLSYRIFRLEEIKTALSEEEFYQVEGVKDNKFLGFEDGSDFRKIVETDYVKVAD